MWNAVFLSHQQKRDGYLYRSHTPVGLCLMVYVCVLVELILFICLCRFLSFPFTVNIYKTVVPVFDSDRSIAVLSS